MSYKELLENLMGETVCPTWPRRCSTAGPYRRVCVGALGYRLPVVAREGVLDYIRQDRTWQ